MSTLDSTPAIRKAVLAFAYDGGFINFLTPEDKVLSEAGMALLVSPFPAEQILKVDEELAKLTPEQLQTFACGEETEARALCSTLAHRLLDYLFEAI